MIAPMPVGNLINAIDASPEGLLQIAALMSSRFGATGQLLLPPWAMIWSMLDLLLPLSMMQHVTGLWAASAQVLQHCSASLAA